MTHPTRLERIIFAELRLAAADECIDLISKEQAERIACRIVNRITSEAHTSIPPAFWDQLDQAGVQR